MTFTDARHVGIAGRDARAFLAALRLKKADLHTARRGSGHSECQSRLTLEVWPLEMRRIFHSPGYLAGEQ